MLDRQSEIILLQERVNKVKNSLKLYEDIKFIELIKATRLILVLWFLSVIVIVSGFLVYLNQYEFISEEIITETTYTQDGEGYNNINTGTQGDVVNGADL